MGKCLSKSIVQESVIHHISSPMRTDDTVGFALGRLSNSHQTRWVKYDEITPSEIEKPVVSVGDNVYVSKPKARISFTQPEKVHSENCSIFLSSYGPQGELPECTCGTTLTVGRPVSLAKSSSGRQSRSVHEASPKEAAESKVLRSGPKPDSENARAKPGLKSNVSQQKPFVDENPKGLKPFMEDNTPPTPGLPSKKGRAVLKESNQNCIPPINTVSKSEQESRDPKCENVKVEDMLPRRISPRVQRPSLTEKEFQALVSPRARGADPTSNVDSAKELGDSTIEIPCIQSNKENVPVVENLSSRTAAPTMGGSLHSIMCAISEFESSESAPRSASQADGNGAGKNSAISSHQRASHAPADSGEVRVTPKSEGKSVSTASSLKRLAVGRAVDTAEVEDPRTPRSVRTKSKSVPPAEATGSEGAAGRNAGRVSQVNTPRAANVRRSSENVRTSVSKVDVIKEVTPSPPPVTHLTPESTSKVRDNNSGSWKLKSGQPRDVGMMMDSLDRKKNDPLVSSEGFQVRDFQVDVQPGASESWSIERSSAENSDGKECWEDANEVSADVKAFLETSKKVVLALGPDAGSESKNVVNNPLFQPTSHVVYGQQQELVFSNTPASFLELETLLVTSADRRQSGCGVEGLQIVGSELTELFSNVVKPASSSAAHLENPPKGKLASSEGRTLKVETKGLDSNGYQSDSWSGENVKGVIHERNGGSSASGRAGVCPPSAKSSNVSVRTQALEARGNWDSSPQQHLETERFVDSSASSDSSDTVILSEVSSDKGSSLPFPQRRKGVWERDISTPSSKVCTMDPTHVNNPCLTRFTDLCRSPDYLQVALEDFQFLLDCAVREEGEQAENSNHSQSGRNPVPSLGKSLLQKIRDSLSNTPIEGSPRGSCGSTATSSPLALGLHSNFVALTPEEIAEIWGAFEQSHLL